MCPTSFFSRFSLSFVLAFEQEYLVIKHEKECRHLEEEQNGVAGMTAREDHKCAIVLAHAFFPALLPVQGAVSSLCMVWHWNMQQHDNIQINA